MDEKELRELLQQRLHLELLLFKDSVLLKKKEDIFKSSYKIETYVNLYEIFAGHTERLMEDTIRILLNLKYGILESFYQEWMERKDKFDEELNTYVCDRLELVLEMGRTDNAGGKENTDGTGQDQAA